MVLASLVLRPDFLCLLEKCVWSTIFVQVGQNVGTLLFSNLTLDVIEDWNPHCVQANYLLAVWIVSGQPSCRNRLRYSIFQKEHD